jgi:hypothetical protein
VTAAGSGEIGLTLQNFLVRADCSVFVAIDSYRALGLAAAFSVPMVAVYLPKPWTFSTRCYRL